MAIKKYSLTDESITLEDGTRVYRIKAERDITGNTVCVIKKGALGGFIESERNLSQFDDSWVKEDAVVYNNGRVLGHSLVTDDAQVYEDAVVSGNAIVRNNAKVYQHARIDGDAVIQHDAHVRGYAIVGGNSYIFANAVVCGHAHVYNTEARGRVYISGKTRVKGAQLWDDTKVIGRATLNGNIFATGACVFGEVDAEDLPDDGDGLPYITAGRFHNVRVEDQKDFCALFVPTFDKQRTNCITFAKDVSTGRIVCEDTDGVIRKMKRQYDTIADMITTLARKPALSGEEEYLLPIFIGGYLAIYDPETDSETDLQVKYDV